LLNEEKFKELLADKDVDLKSVLEAESGLKTPIVAFVTFETQEGYERCLKFFRQRPGHKTQFLECEIMKKSSVF
jgi:hypothetical protein